MGHVDKQEVLVETVRMRDACLLQHVISDNQMHDGDHGINNNKTNLSTYSRIAL